MKILHINFSKSGGAGTFAEDLVSAQNASGIEARLINLRDTDLRSEPWRDPLLTFQAILDEYLVKQPTFKSPISLIRQGNRMPRSVMNFNPDLIHLHWIEGVLTDAFLNEVSIPIVWTLHDFRPISGACHHPLSCVQMSNGCTSCPAVRPFFQSLVSSSVSKRVLSGLYDKIYFVAPSEWVAGIAKKSVALSGREVPVIYNASSASELNGKDIHSLSGITNQDRPIVAIAFGSSASSLKGQELLNSFSIDVFDGHHVITFGAGNLHWADENLGVISREQVSEIFAKAKLTVIPSKAETFSLTAFEATQKGSPVSGLTGGAVQEIAEKFGEFIPLEQDTISSFLKDKDYKLTRVVKRVMTDVVSEYSCLYQKALSSR